MVVEQKTPEQLIFKEFEQFISNCHRFNKPEQKELIRKAFDFAYSAHKGSIRYSGTAYINHSLEVAKIVVMDMGLCAKSAAAALLHDVPEKTEYDVEDIRRNFGDKIANIVDGLTKIKKSEYFENNAQASKLRQILLSISDDIRVIFIKIADRLNNLSTLKYLPASKQEKVIDEALNIYSPLAHRLGLYEIKSEFEDQCLKYRHPEIYAEIEDKLKLTERSRLQFINRFMQPIKQMLDENGIEYTIKSRAKTVYSIWNKMQKKKVSFEEVYDLFALRIIFKPTSVLNENFEALYIGTLISNLYHEKTDRTRNWLDKGKDTGYRALHLTVMSNEGRWVEVQIRSESMHEAAEYGLAAHWKYKGINEKKNEFDSKVRELLEHLNNENTNDATEFLDTLKLNLFASEIHVFTPKGEIISLPKGATVLDFAFQVNTELAFKSIAAKKNGKPVGLEQQLCNGDQIQMITSEKQKPKHEWINIVVTQKAIQNLRTLFRQERKIFISKGKEIVDLFLKNYKVPNVSDSYLRISAGLGFFKKDMMFYEIGSGLVTENYLESKIKELFSKKNILYWEVVIPEPNKDRKNKVIFQIATCCKPLPGDNVIGESQFSDPNKILIHKNNCPVAKIANYENREQIVEWSSYTAPALLTGIVIKGTDAKGVANKITSAISNELSVNMKSLEFRAEDGKFEGKINLYVQSNKHLKKMIKQLYKIIEIKEVEHVNIHK